MQDGRLAKNGATSWRRSFRRSTTGSNFFQRVWQDTEHSTIEDSVPQIVATMMKIGVECRRETERRVQEDRFRSIERQQLERLQRLNKAEEIRAQRLEEAAINWARAKQIRDYVLAMAKCCTARGQQLNPKTALGKWVTWALEKAGRLDPLAGAATSNLDEKP